MVPSIVATPQKGINPPLTKFRVGSRPPEIPRMAAAGGFSWKRPQSPVEPGPSTPEL